VKLLLHTCCAPCIIHPFRELYKKEFDSVAGFFYNPNIHPYTEYVRRKDALEEYSKRRGIPVVFHKYDMENFLRHISGNEQFGARCRICWRIRLEETAAFAAKERFDFFTTTLLVSPYQNQEDIKRIGLDLEKRFDVQFYYKDFRGGFKSAQLEAKDEGLYRQKYCGCIFSERERYKKIKEKE